MRVFPLVLAIAAAACGGTTSRPPVVQPGPPGQSGRPVDADRRAPAYSEADVRFIQGMIHHHAQALEMTTLIASRTTNEAMKLLAKRIDVSQTDEIRMMQRWLKDRGQNAPDPLAHQDHDMASMAGMPMTGTLMPGMLTRDEMARLADARDAAFDRLFLECMIKHHEGALVMVRALFASAGAGQTAEIFTFASDVEADQRAEIDRMRRMRAELER
jgi:uncharacterized protein (DUF305 family)